MSGEEQDREKKAEEMSENIGSKTKEKNHVDF
jgi:hypothetical protein